MNKALELLSNTGIKILKNAYEAGTSTANVVIGIGAAGFIISMVAQLSAIKSNKNITEEKRKFLRNQETVDGLTNTTLFIFLTSALSSAVKKQLEMGNILTPKIKEQLLEAARNTGRKYEDIIKDAKVGKGQKDYKHNIGKVIKDADVFKEVKRMEKGGAHTPEFKDIQPEADTFETTKSGLAMIATIVGSIISGNFISPLVRNKVSNHLQEKYNAEHLVTVKYPTNMLTPRVYNNKSTFSTFSSITKI